jgi:hypothetical protein
MDEEMKYPVNSEEWRQEITELFESIDSCFEGMSKSVELIKRMVEEKMEDEK